MLINHPLPVLIFPLCDSEGHPTVATDAERILLFSWFLQTDVMSRSEDIKELQAKWKRQGLPPSEPPYFVVHEIDYRVYPPRMGMGPGERWEKEASPEHWESIREEMRENQDYILVFAIFPAGASSSVSALRAIPLECPGCDDPNCASRQASMT
ncbi:hypothetical protein VKT23_006412 [Stygiomarasmius scandens]|uniref:Uncharacterized protein n=1 Tax=Marasmiellus scandens TaxID=2682957 RepID=A0ABR1JSD6_9AGAR